MLNNAVISLRQDYLQSRKEYRDSIDISWYEIILSWNMIPNLIPNCQGIIKQYLNVLKPKLIILSGGGDVELTSNNKIIKTPRNNIEMQLIEYSMQNKITLLGVCRGQQIINIFFKGNIQFVDLDGGHNNTIHEIYNTQKGQINKFSVNSYHNFIIGNENLSKELKPLWKCSSDGSIEAYKHKNYKIYGISWHPEREGGNGLELVKQIINHEE